MPVLTHTDVAVGPDFDLQYTQLVFEEGSPLLIFVVTDDSDGCLLRVSLNREIDAMAMARQAYLVCDAYVTNSREQFASMLAVRYRPALGMGYNTVR